METFENRGWKSRRKVAIAKTESWHDDERLAVRAEREKLYAETEAANAAAAAVHAAAVAAARCTCVVCDGSGTMKAEDAVRILEAVSRYDFAGHRPSQAAVNLLVRMINGEELPFGQNLLEFRAGLHRPRLVGHDGPAELITPNETHKPSKSKASKASGDESYTHDGALIEP